MAKEEQKLREESVTWFAELFGRTYRPDSRTRFCFVLGAGASQSSKVPTATELAWEWAEELARRRGFADAEALIEDRNWDADNLGSNYFEIYDEMFDYDTRDGLKAIDKAISRSEGPRIGYAFLARILADKRHNLAITVNFDNLIADAVFLYTAEYPMLCSHESLASFLRPGDDKPIIAKIHRDRALAPMSKRKEMDRLSEEWRLALDEVFKYYTPVFLGYGANDRSLMGYLNEYKARDGRFVAPPVWFVFAKTDGDLPEKDVEPIRKFLLDNEGVLIRHGGFDYVMNELAGALGWKIDDLGSRLDAKYRTQRGLLDEFFVDSAAVAASIGSNGVSLAKDATTSFEKVVEKGSASDYILRASTLPPEMRVNLFGEAITRFPGDARLYRSRGAAFRELGHYDAAAADFRSAVEMQPSDVAAYIDLETSLRELGCFEEALDIIDRAIELDPHMDVLYWHRWVTQIASGSSVDSMDSYRSALQEGIHRGDLLYEIAQKYAKRGNDEQSVKALMSAINFAPIYRERARNDAAFASLRGNQEFRTLVGGE